MTHTISSLGKVLVSPLVAALFFSFSQVGVCAASIPASEARQAKQSPAKNVRVKRAPTAHKKVVRKAAPQPAAAQAAVAPAPDTPVGVALKPSHAVATEMPRPAQAAENGYVPQGNPYLQRQQPSAPAYATNGAPASGNSGFRFSMPQIPLFEQSILPKIQTVYPTGEKPLVVVTFKCPTELVGIDTPSTLILHKVVNGGMDVINKTNLLSFNMQQVCQ